MSILENLQERPRLTRGIVIALSAIAVLLFFWQLSGGASSNGEGRRYLTTDDGKTFFVDKQDELPPLQVNGKVAYRAYLFSGDDGKTSFVGYMERYDENAKNVFAVMGKKRGDTKTGPLDLRPEKLLAGTQVKRPGETVWVPQSDMERASKIMDVRCPQDPNRPAERIMP